VKQYWNNFDVITEEDRLHEMSLQCEPSTHPARRQPAVPEPVNLLTMSGPKFGQQSPHAVQKLLSLSEATKVRQHNSHSHVGKSAQPVSRSSATSPKPPFGTSKGVHQNGLHFHGRTHSEATGSFGFSLRPPYANIKPLDLSAESSSVTTGVINLVALRKSQSGKSTL
jgi:Rap guanine nucleotide exchange factor 2